MEEKNVTTYRLIQEGIDAKIIHNLKHDISVTVYTLDKICGILGCTVDQVVEIKQIK
ncbi:helix-turn-helix transcriptional regulator [Enterocloster bolteae]|uniref:helix-turn-helix domain-containing protein n=1 Tax=Enterocloster bolteae TaxID=208479 RepID=UPI002A7F0535|nr:helix-turn-helix transcriptional regulator [Enterocloster bolteae]